MKKGKKIKKKRNGGKMQKKIEKFSVIQREK